MGGIKEILPAHYGTAKTDNSSHYRNVAFSNKPKICERCGYGANEKAIIIHHKDRNRNNNKLSNLELICPNCHYEEHFLRKSWLNKGLRKIEK